MGERSAQEIWRPDGGGASPWSHADERELRVRAAAREERTRPPAWIAWLDSRDRFSRGGGAGD